MFLDGILFSWNFPPPRPGFEQHRSAWREFRQRWSHKKKGSGKGLSFYEERLRIFQDLWDNFATTHEKLLSQLPSADEYFTQDIYTRCKEQFEKAKERITLAKVTDFLTDPDLANSDTTPSLDKSKSSQEVQNQSKKPPQRQQGKS
ncbi:hypothetical protein DMENIID0001_140660 [Sergentomyia squamirostris]